MPIINLQHFYILLLLIGLPISVNSLWAQATLDKDYRTKAIYFPQSNQLQVKFVYYFDYWAEHEVRDGAYTEWNEDGNIVEEGSYKEDKKDGVWNTFFPNGLLKSSTNWQNGLQHGKEATFGKDGQKEEEGFYRNGLKDGVFIAFYPSDQIKSRIQYKAGKLHGKSQYYSSSGELQKEIEFRSGKKHGNEKESASKKDHQGENTQTKTEEKWINKLFYFKKKDKSGDKGIE